jgi:hypothetical protein
MLLHLYLNWPIDTYRLIFNKCQIWIRAPPEATIFKKRAGGVRRRQGLWRGESRPRSMSYGGWNERGIVAVAALL